MKPPPRSVARLLRDLFSPAQLRQVLRDDPQGEEIVRSLPSHPASDDEFFELAVETLHRFGALDPSFFARIKLERPRRARDIDAVAALCSSGDARSRLTLYFDAPAESVDLLRLTRLVEELRRASGDDTLVLLGMRRGSVLVDIETSHEGADILVLALLEGRLEAVVDLRLVAVMATDADAPRDTQVPWTLRLTPHVAEQSLLLRAPPELARHTWIRSRYHGGITGATRASLALDTGYDLELPAAETLALLDTALLSAVLEITDLSPLLPGPIARAVLPRVLDVGSLSFAREGNEIVAAVAAWPPDARPTYDVLPDDVRDSLAPDDYTALLAACRPGSEAVAPLTSDAAGPGLTLRFRITLPRR